MDEYDCDLDDFTVTSTAMLDVDVGDGMAWVMVIGDG